MKTIKVVDNGNVFNSKHWYTFYCSNCGAQITHGMDECKGTDAFSKGCGAKLNWNELGK